MIRLCMAFLLWASLASAQNTLRVASYNVGLGRDGPGLLLKDILQEKPDILAIARIISTVNPDILLLTGFDNDFENVAIERFAALTGLEYRYIYAPLGNGGRDSGLDINGNGRLRDWNDNWGFGRFEGSEGMALLSRYPVTNSRRFDQLKWQDFGPPPLKANGELFFAHWPALRLAAHSLWDVEITLPNGALSILAAHPTPPVFDGEEDANGLRNAAEISFLERYLGGEAMRDDAGLVAPLADTPVILLADLNADPARGESRKPGLRALLAHPRLQPMPAYDTVDWERAGRMQVDYVLPDARLKVLESGVYWPENETLLDRAKTRHRLIWADIALP